MKITAKQITKTAVLLALCILSQYFKNLSVLLTGSIVNCILIIATLAVGMASGVILSIIAPITAFFFTGSPIMAAIPWMFPVVMAGNLILVVSVGYFYNKTSFKGNLEIGMVIGSAAKSAFMGIVIVLLLLPNYSDAIASRLPKPEALPKVLATARTTFSTTQLVTALIGSALAWLIWLRLSKVVKNEDV